jgi:integrase
MRNANLSRLTDLPPSRWQLPIHPEMYLDRHPHLTDEEKELMQQYATAPASFMTGGRARNVLHRLERFEAPFMDIVHLTSPMDTTVTAARRYLFTWMGRTERAFWTWPKEIWVEAIQHAPGAKHASGTRFWMLLLAYLFCDMLYVGTATAYWPMAETIFGRELAEAGVNKVRTQLTSIGYAGDQRKEGRLRWITALCMLVNRNPLLETFSAQLLTTVDDLLPAISGAGHTQGRWALLRLQTALCYLGVLDEPVLLDLSQQKTLYLPARWQNDPTVDPIWLAWVCAFYDQTPSYDERRRRQMCYSLLMAGRWLKQHHPEIREPADWTEALAAEYVTYTCQALLSDLRLPSPTSSFHTQQVPQRLSPRTIDGRLIFMRSFFSHLQRRTYTVNGQPRPKLQLTWLPHEAFRTPNTILAACQPNPKDIAEDTWFKLIWAACTLTQDKLRAHSRNPQYPLAYYRAAALIWVTAARRSDEIRRLHQGCVSREWAPQMQDEQGVPIEPAEELCYLRVPTNKMRGEFYVPIPSYVADAILVWESVRPPNQEPLLDRKTRKPTHYLFQYRNELMGQKFLNGSVIPLLCKLAGVNQTDVVGRITSHRARATTATWMHKMGMAPSDIGRLLGHTDPLKSLPWYLREDKHHLGRAYRKANPLERYVAAILDTNAQARQEPCVFYYLSDGPEGRPSMCGNPHFSRCIHQMKCIECEAFIDHELAETFEKREGAVLISVPVPLPPQMVAELNEQEEAESDAMAKLAALPPPLLPSPAFHFNKKVALRSVTASSEDLRARLAQVEAQIAKKQGKADRRNASLQALLREQAELKTLIETQQASDSATDSRESV